MPSNMMFRIVGGNPPNPGSGEVSFAFDETAAKFKIFDGTTLHSISTDQNLEFSAVGNGAIVGSSPTTTVVETGNGVVHSTTITFTDRALAVTDALAYAGSQIYDFPEGRIFVLGCTANLRFGVTSARASTINDSAAMDWSVGTVTASNVTLTGTMVDLIPKVDHTLDGAVDAYTALAGSALAAAAQFDGTSAAKDAFLNVSFPTITDIDADGTLKVAGTVTMTWINLGDY